MRHMIPGVLEEQTVDIIVPPPVVYGLLTEDSVFRLTDETDGILLLESQL